MKEGQETIDLEKMQAFFAERARWASLSVTIEEIAHDNKALVKELSRYDSQIAIPLISSLLTIPEYQTNCIRLEVLLALVVTYCNGKKKPENKDIGRWFYKIGKSKSSIGEDPAEDVFVSLVQGENGDYRILEGVWEAAGFYTQIVLDVVLTMPNGKGFDSIKRSVISMLKISDELCRKSKLRRYQLGSDEIHDTISIGKLPKRSKLISRVNIPIKYLDDRGIELHDLKPFLFHPSMIEELTIQQVGNSYLDKYPLTLLSDSQLTVLLPTAISVGIREFIINTMVEYGLTDSFDKVLAQKYSNLFFKTPLLGGPLHAPAYRKNKDRYHTSSFGFKVDEGYYISFHLFLPSIVQHGSTGFKDPIVDDGDLTKELQESINNSVDHFSKEEGFKEGLVVLVGCGWGKGYATNTIEFEYPNWRFEHISAADLIRISWIGKMNPSYFWRIEDGLTAIENHGVTIENINGILNLIGWVRENNGHFVPHTQLLEGKITSEHPLMIQIPTNLLRNVRADSYNCYDRHSIQDNTGMWHEVQYDSAEPLFPTDSSKKTYASMTDVERKILTSVYEGKFNLWLTIKAEYIEEAEVEYHLWKMGHEWLHRIGREFDKNVKNISSELTFRVYAEFRDETPSHKPTEKPDKSNLILLCETKETEEKNAGIAVFNKGFLDGFAFAENIAERLFVMNVVRVFLSLIDEDDVSGKTDDLLGKIVENNEARSFHFFRAQHFIDYVQDSLPKKFIEIDDINDGIVKLGLGWRALKKDLDGDNKLFGREECNDFLNEAVDILISELTEMLSKFNRKSTLLKLIANSEKAGAEKDHWKRTSAAVLGLHGKNDKTTSTYVKEASKFAGAGIASRVLIEMALCICPLDKGEILSDIEISKLLARASLVVRYGGLSDAIRFNALPPELHISALGDILFKDDFGEIVVQPMLSQVSGDSYISDAPRQVKNYDDPVITGSAKKNIDKQFWDIWIEEMGFNIDEARNIIEILEDHGIDQRKAIFEVKRNDFIKLVCKDVVSTVAAENFLKQFVLRTRKHWEKTPKGFTLDEIYPWRYGRRLSFATRPILEIDTCDNPTLIVSPGALRKGFTYLFDGTFRGRFKQAFYKTDKMKNEWWGKASEGHSFNAEAAKKLKEKGWNIKENIGLPEILNKKLDKDYGDIDILAWNPKRIEVLIIECKDLSFARNYSEIAALLSTFQGTSDKKGKGDQLKKHLDRVCLVNRHLPEVKKYTQLSEIKIISCLIFSGVVPMQFAKIKALNTSVVATIDDLILMYS